MNEKTNSVNDFDSSCNVNVNMPHSIAEMLVLLLV